MLKPAIRLVSFENMKLKIIIGNLLIKTSPNSIMYWPPTWLLSKKSFSIVDPDLFKTWNDIKYDINKLRIDEIMKE